MYLKEYIPWCETLAIQSAFQSLTTLSRVKHHSLLSTFSYGTFLALSLLKVLFQSGSGSRQMPHRNSERQSLKEKILKPWQESNYKDVEQNIKVFNDRGRAPEEGRTWGRVLLCKAVIQVSLEKVFLAAHSMVPLSLALQNCPELGGGGLTSLTSYYTQAAPGRGCALAMTEWDFLVM